MARVLITEDNSVFRRKLRDFLCSRFPSLSVKEAVDGSEAFASIAAWRPDFMFLDIRLPGVNGIELTRTIKERYPEILIIILTSYDFPEYRQAAYENGADYFLVKGSTGLSDIAALVKRLVSRTTAYRENGG
jgi:DNA-binding NarL/FixJ family response regulator